MTSLQPEKPAYQGSTVPGTPPLELTLVTLPSLGGHPGRETARGALARAALKDCLEAWSGPLSFGQAVTGLHKELEGSAILVAAPKPVELVAQALEDGLDPGTALEAWRTLSRDLTAFLERRRNTILLVWDAAVLRDPATVAEEVAARLGLDVVTPAPPVLTQEAPPSPGPRHLLQAELSLARLENEAAAPSLLDRYWLNLPDHADGPLRHRLETDVLLQRIAEEERAAGQTEIRAVLRDAEEAWLGRETRRIEAHAEELARERAAQKTETDRHLAEILRLSQEAEYYRGLSEKLQSSEAAAPDRAQIEALERDLKAREQALQKARAEMERLEKRARDNIDQLAARLETAQNNAKKARAEKAGLEKRARDNIDQLATRLETAQSNLKKARLRSSEIDNKAKENIRRLTSELETARSLVARDRERARENEAEIRRLRDMIGSSNARRKAAEDRSAHQASELDGLRSELEAARADIAAARAETEALRGSTSWRVTRPLRGIGSLLRRRPAPSSPAPENKPLPDQPN
jgi:chromosome segregation protein